MLGESRNLMSRVRVASSSVRVGGEGLGASRSR